MLRFGIGMLVVSIVLFAFFLRGVLTDNPTLVDIPLDFRTENHVSRTFTTSTKETCTVQVDLQKTIPFDRLTAVVAGLSHQDSLLNVKRQEVPVVTCSVKMNGQEVMQKGNGYYFSNTVGANVGTFTGIPNRQFTLEAHIASPLPRLQMLQPRLKITGFPKNREQNVFGRAVNIVLGSATFLVGVICLASALIRRRRSERYRSYGVVE